MLVTADAYGLKFLVPEGDPGVGQALRAHGEFARVLLDVIAQTLPALGPGAFVDVGANVGAVCLPVAARHPARRVLALEAHRGLSAVLAANALCNGLTNVEVTHALVGREPGVRTFDTPPLTASVDFGMLAVAAEGDFAERVLVKTLDEVAPRDTRLVKIDVEGHELEVIQGARRLVRETRPAWIVEALQKHEPDVRTCLRLFLEEGYRAFLFHAPHVVPKPGGGGVVGEWNLLFHPDSAAECGWPEVRGPDDPWPKAEAANQLLRRYVEQGASVVIRS
jgi:FkbM family methyltransferase